MRKFLDFEDGSSWELSPITYDEFDRLDKWHGSPDVCFGQWLRHNNFHELSQLSPDPRPKAKPGIRIESGEPTIDWGYYDMSDYHDLGMHEQ